MAISTATLEKCNTTNNMEVNKAYTQEDDEDVTNRFQVAVDMATFTLQLCP